MSKLNSFNFRLKITINQIDELKHVNNIHYVEWVQLAAQRHWKLLSNEQIDSKFVWVVLRHEIDYVSAVTLGDEVKITTWIGDSYGVKSERFVEITKGNKIVAKAKTIWCLLDKVTMRPVRIPLEILNILTTKDSN